MTQRWEFLLIFLSTYQILQATVNSTPETVMSNITCPRSFLLKSLTSSVWSHSFHKYWANYFYVTGSGIGIVDTKMSKKLFLSFLNYLTQLWNVGPQISIKGLDEKTIFNVFYFSIVLCTSSTLMFSMRTDCYYGIYYRITEEGTPSSS